jgi:hypothetical protein
VNGNNPQERVSNFVEARKVVEDRLYVSIGCLVDKVKTLPESVEDFEALAGNGKLQQVVFLSEDLRVLFSSYGYMLLEELIKAEDIETADRIHLRYCRMGISYIKPIHKFW